VRHSRWLLFGGCLLLASSPLAAPGAPHGRTHEARNASRNYSISRCGAPAGTTYLTYDDANYKRPYAVVRLAAAARSMHVGLGIFHVSSVTKAYLARTGVNIPQRLRDKGMYVNNHTYSHPDLTRLSDHRIRNQIRRGIDSAWLRPPYGAYNSRVRTRAHALGYRLCTWTFDTNDWKGGSGSSICSDIVHHAAKGSVVLMHLNHSAANPRSLACIVHGLRHHGHQLCRPYTATHPRTATPVKLYRLPC